MAEKADNPTVPVRPAQPPLPTGARVMETSRYRIYSSATPGQTEQVAKAVENLYSAYTSFFGIDGDVVRGAERLELVLYKDRAEFSRNNRSSPWAEAYYLWPRCHAYFAEGKANPYHWMVHEATHQLTKQIARFPKARWADEGLAAYFATSRISGDRILLGDVDPDAYPIWWLPDLQLGGDAEADIETGRFIPLHAILTGKGGPGINEHVNLYYIEYWSLSHFLFHYEDGKYAARYRRLLSEGATPGNFERIIGPVDAIQAEWYDYLRVIALSQRERAGVTPALRAAP